MKRGFVRVFDDMFETIEVDWYFSSEDNETIFCQPIDGTTESFYTNYGSLVREDNTKLSMEQAYNKWMLNNGFRGCSREHERYLEAGFYAGWKALWERD